MKKQRLVLHPTDEAYLQGLLSKGSLTAKVFKRATALLELNRGKSFGAVAETLGVCYQSVSTWCTAYKKEGLGMLHDAPRSGRPIEIDGSQRAKITALACSAAPEGYARWSLRLLADKAVELGYCEHLSHNYAGELLKKTNSSRI
ncbi:MAG: helix-turn-helix domain-containing protein [Bacteroidota bacterium]|nr:helix-turn-helix domain-containing protein [Bacteroidota bacterium]